MNRRKEILNTVYKTTLEYLREGIDDFDTIVRMVAETLGEDFAVKPVVANNMAKKYVEEIWLDVIAEAQTEAENAADFSSEYLDALGGRY